MAIIVPDASIILKWVLAGEDKAEEEKSLSILNDWLEGKYQIILPPLWLFEVGNVLGLKRPNQAQTFLEALLDYQFEEAKITKNLSHLTFKLMQELDVSFYDAVYHALAIAQKGTLITADKRYFNKAAGKGYLQLLTA